MKKLEKSIIDDAFAASKVYSNYCGKIEERVTYIVRFLAGKDSVWWTWGYDEHEDGDFAEACDGDELQLTGDWIKYDMTFVDKHGDEWELDSGIIPTRWLYEDFEEEFVNGVKLYKEKEKLKKEKTKENATKRKLENQALIKSATQKLSKEERAAIGLKVK